MSEAQDSPAERRRVKVRERILSAAEHVFATEGADGLSIRRLADKIDYSPAAIYKYFGSKDELVNELKESFFGLLLGNVKQMHDPARPAGEQARMGASIYMGIAAEKPYHYAAAFTGGASLVGPSDDEPGFENTKKGQAFMVLKSIISEGIESGAFRADLDATLTAKSVWSSLHGLAMMIAHIPSFPAMRPGKPALSQEAFIAFHADLIVRGLEERP